MGEIFYIDWTSEILAAGQGDGYSSTVTITYEDIGVTETNEISLVIDKVPDPFTLDEVTNVFWPETVEANSIAMLGSINAPAYIWGATDGPSAEVSIGPVESWGDLPSTPGVYTVNSKDLIRVRHTTKDGDNAETYTNVRIGLNEDEGEFTQATFKTTNAKTEIVKPVITYPPQNATGMTVFDLPVKTTGYVPSGDVGDLQLVRWELATDVNFMNIILTDNVDTSSETNWKIPPNLMSGTVTYHLRVTFFSSKSFAAMSDVVTFTTGNRKFSYIDARSYLEYPVPTKTPEHTVFEIQCGAGNNGTAGQRGTGNQHGPRGLGGDQGVVTIKRYKRGTGDITVTLDTTGGTQITSSKEMVDGNAASILAHQIGTDKDGNPVTIANIVSGGLNINAGAAGNRGESTAGPQGGGGGAGGIYFSYAAQNPNEWEQDRGVPADWPVGGKGGNGSRVDCDYEGQNRGANGGYGGTGWGCGAGGGAGGTECREQHWGGGGAGYPGGTAGALIIVI